MLGLDSSRCAPSSGAWGGSLRWELASMLEAPARAASTGGTHPSKLHVLCPASACVGATTLPSPTPHPCAGVHDAGAQRKALRVA